MSEPRTQRSRFAGRWTVRDSLIGVGALLFIAGLLQADPNPNVQAMFPWPGYQQPIGVGLAVIGVALLYRLLREPSPSGVIAPVVRRHRLGIAVAYFVAAPLASTLLTPGDDLSGPTIALLLIWLAGLPLFWFLRGLPAPVPRDIR